MKAHYQISTLKTLDLTQAEAPCIFASISVHPPLVTAGTKPSREYV
jgi:hypothetical protein